MKSKTKKWYHCERYDGTLEFDGLKVLMIAMIGFLIVFMGIAGYDVIYKLPYAAENALQECREMGYASYVSYERVFLTTKPLGLRCENPINPIHITGAVPVSVVDS